MQHLKIASKDQVTEHCFTKRGNVNMIVVDVMNSRTTLHEEYGHLHPLSSSPSFLLPPLTSLSSLANK